MLLGTYKRKLDKQHRVSLPWDIVHSFESVGKKQAARQILGNVGRDTADLQGEISGRRVLPVAAKFPWQRVYIWPSPDLEGILVSSETLFMNWANQFNDFADSREQERASFIIFSRAMRGRVSGENNRLTIPKQHRKIFSEREHVFIVGLGYMIAILIKEPEHDNNIWQKIVKGSLWPLAPTSAPSSA
jgi:DNA-binding transcriptional regulator/RsmH inhibitor MraZ